MPIKTLHVTNYYHDSSGGIRTFYRALLAAANRHRRKVRLVVPGRREAVEEVGQFGRIYTIAAPRSPLFDSRYRLLLPHLYALPYESSLKRILRIERPNLVEICDKYTLCFLPAFLRKESTPCVTPPVIVGLSCERLDDNVSAFVSSGSFGRRFAGWYMRTVYAPRFDCHISNSDYTGLELSQALGHRPDIAVHMCPMGVSAESFSPQRRTEANRREIFAPFTGARNADSRLLLYVGRVSAEKNIPLLLEMMDVLRNDASAAYRLVIAGSGPKEAELAGDAARRAPGRVIFLGQISDRERLADIYANCDALIHPNPREPFGIAPLEAMASGLPVVVPNAGGVLSYANSSNAWVAEPNGQAFSGAVEQIFSDAQCREARIAQALQTAAAFDWSRVTQQFFQLYDDLHASLAVPVTPRRPVSRFRGSLWENAQRLGLRRRKLHT